MGGRGKKFRARKRAPKPPTPRKKRQRTSRATKQQILFYDSRAQSAINAARRKGLNTISFEALTGKRVRALDVKFTGGTGTVQIAGTLPLSRISVMKSAGTINLSGKKSLDNINKWHKGTAYDSDNARPFRVQILKNNQAVIHKDDTARFAHYLATGGDRNNIRVVYNTKRITSKMVAEAQKKFADGKIRKKALTNILNAYEQQTQINALKAELRGDRSFTTVRRGGTLGNQTGVRKRSPLFSRGKWTGVYIPAATTSQTRYYPFFRKSRSKPDKA